MITKTRLYYSDYSTFDTADQRIDNANQEDVQAMKHWFDDRNPTMTNGPQQIKDRPQGIL